MAYMSQERKAKLAPAIKAALKKYGLKGTIAVNNHSTLVVNIKSGKIDFIGNYNKTISDKMYGNRSGDVKDYMQINPYWYHEHFTGSALDALKEIISAMMVGHYDRSDIQTDYFDISWYVDVNIGQWNKPYEVIV